MNVEEYLRRREEHQNTQPKYRALCSRCMQPEFSCYCAHVRSFDPGIKFVLLIHPIEQKRRIATGRMAHLCLEGSELLVNQDYSNNARVNELVRDPRYHPVILYPGRTSKNLTTMAAPERAALFPAGKIPLVFVIDGTWATARKTMRQSQNLIGLPRVCFTPPGPSRFRVRKQPEAECFSTIEAVHHAIELLNPAFGIEGRAHDALLHVFDRMVERQLEFIREAWDNPKPGSYRKPRYRVA